MKRTIRRTLPAPRTILGFRQDGRPIYPILGASEDDPSNDHGAGDSGGGDEADDDLTPEEEAALGDPGKQAIEREKEKRKAAVEAKRAAEDRAEQLAQQLAEATRKGDAADVEAAVREATAEIAAEYQAKVAQAEIRAAAIGKVVDVDLILSLPEFNPTNFVTESGDVDEQKIADAITSLVSSKPYLAAQGQGVKGSGDGGTRNGSQPSQLTRTDLARMSPEEIRKAQDEGRLEALLSGT